VKDKIWENLKQTYPTMIDLFKSNDHYVFVSVSQEAKTIEYYDYSKRLCDLKLFFTFFKVIEAHGNIAENSYNSDLSKFFFIHDTFFSNFHFKIFKKFKCVLKKFR
jgi:hypothetical protein